MNKRELMSSVAVRLGVNDIIGYVRSHLEPRITILAYHRVMSFEKSCYPFDLSLVSSSPELFEWQIKYILKRFTPVRFEDIVRFVNCGDPLPKRPIVLTFDDGFDDNYHVVFPIAKKYDIPFSIFLSTDYVGSDDTFWFERLAYLFARAPAGKITFSSEDEYTLIDSIGERRQSYTHFVERLKYFPHHKRIQLLSQIFEKYRDVFESITEADRKLSRPLNWEQVREMAEWGVEFGAHGASHNILTTMSASQMRDELMRSKQTIEDRLAAKVRTFSYPNGLVDDYCPELDGILNEAGYDIAVSYVPGAVSIKNIRDERYFLKRVHVDNNIGKNVLPVMLNFPDRLI